MTEPIAEHELQQRESFLDWASTFTQLAFGARQDQDRERRYIARIRQLEAQLQKPSPVPPR